MPTPVIIIAIITITKFCVIHEEDPALAPGFLRRGFVCRLG